MRIASAPSGRWKQPIMLGVFVDARAALWLEPQTGSRGGMICYVRHSRHFRTGSRISAAQMFQCGRRPPLAKPGGWLSLGKQRGGGGGGRLRAHVRRVAKWWP